ncbi:hypothetical protein [Herpetosiphon llansteffanensis]|uniref:hypothetical protein n=1 Tax=Herpetosiphon llansteffanensis TaxID=2094568 RepID=UPI000F519C19|nr:hypothetical protein [Herpetosiphon llansteffanensis]
MRDTYQYLDVGTLENIRAIQRNNLSYLAVQAEKFGDLFLPFYIQNQIEDTKQNIDSINEELARRGIASNDPPPGTMLRDIVKYYVDARTINIEGGDYADTLNKSSIPISDSTLNGIIAGVNHGSMKAQQDIEPPISQANVLRRAYAEAQQQARLARNQNLPTARALVNAEFSLEMAIQAETTARANECQAAIVQARQDIALISDQSSVQELLRLLAKLLEETGPRHH